MVGKWANTSSSITTIKANNGGSGSYAEGSELIVWGSDGASDTTSQSTYCEWIYF